MGLFTRSNETPEPSTGVEEAGDTATEEASDDRPTGCPTCGGAAYLDYIDLRANVQLEHCKQCGVEWKRPIT